MPDTTIKELLEAGAHFGHQTSRWHPRMKRYIFTKRNGIHIIDLEQTAGMLAKAVTYVKQLVAEGAKSCSWAPKSRPRPSLRKRPGAPVCSTSISAGLAAR